MSGQENPGARAAVKPAAWLPPLLVALAAWGIFHRATAYFFAQDDFAALGRAAGLLPRFHEP